MLPWEKMTALCGSVDIFVSDRRLPAGCTPRWLKLDRETLARTGGVAITFGGGNVRTVAGTAGAHPWVDPPSVMPPFTGPRNKRRGP